MPLYHLDDTICAIATASGGAARGMVRVSGSDAVDVVSKLFSADDGRQLNEVRRPTAISGRTAVELDGARVAPCDLFLWPGSRSYTREPVAELHSFGCPPFLDATLAALCRAGARLAEPGEFTLRAFLAGRLDLTQAEGVLGVIEARGESDLQAGLAQLAGGLSRPLQQLREDLLQLLAELEAGLDFVEDDLQFVSTDEIRERLEAAGSLLSDLANQMASRHASSGALQVALLGEPNAGKSSLFNALLSRRRGADGACRASSPPALVSEQRGTTRDYLTGLIELDELQCELIDTAGIDPSAGDRAEFSTVLLEEIHSAAQFKAAERREQAAVRLYCVDASQLDSSWPGEGVADLIVLTKIDLNPSANRFASGLPSRPPVVLTSSRTGEGLDELCGVLRELLMGDSASWNGQVVGATASRCRESIRLASDAIARGGEIAQAKAGDELLAAELRTALSELGKVVGAVYTDDVLDRIFSSFCIGK